jgi:glyoxylase-like metal-dependent hydrolase (beta-lactamase superfamily II)
MTDATLDSLAPGVYAWVSSPSGHGHTNAGVVIDDDGITVVDTLMTRSQWEPFGDAVESLGHPIRRVVLTSSHIDFVGGTPRFWSAARFGRPQTSAHLDQPPNVEGYRRLFPDLAREFKDDLVTKPITHVVAEPAWLTPAALAIPVTGQQAENLVIQVPGADLLFGGALCCFGVTPNAFDGYPEAWADTLGDLATMAGTIVPGIGPVGGPGELVAQQAYLYACVEADGDPSAIPAGPWDEWSDRDLDVVNVERAALLARGDDTVPPSMLTRLGLT